MPGENGVRVERPRDGVAVVVLDRPDRLNALDAPMFAALAEVFPSLDADASVHAVVVTGAGRGFCAGLDLKAEPPPSEREAARLWMQDVHRAPLALHDLAKPTIAAVNGAAAGGGLGLALACDIRIAGPSAAFSAPFVRMGLTPDYGTSRLLPHAVGTERAMELFLTGRKVGPDEAMAMGLVLQVAENALEAAVTLAATIAGMPGDGAVRMKALVRASTAADQQTALLEHEAAAQAIGLSDPEFLERASAWMAARGG